MADFVSDKFSQDLPESSYHPGLVSVPLHDKLPKRIRTRLQEAFKLIDKKAHGYLTNEAIIVGVESRTSSPIRIPRKDDTFEHVKIAGLYPCGEGAGYAGGIVSSAMDGERCAEAFAENYSRKIILDWVTRFPIAENWRLKISTPYLLLNSEQQIDAAMATFQ